MAVVRVVRLSKQLDTLPAEVRAARLQRGLSHRQAATEMGVAYADLCRFENGKKDPQLSTIKKLAAWLEAQCSCGAPFHRIDCHASGTGRNP